MAKKTSKSQVLGDDPLAWLNAGDSSPKKTEKKSKKTKKEKPKKTAKKKPGTKKSTPAKSKPVKKQAREKSPEKIVDADAANTKNRLVLDSSVVINKAGDLFKSLEQLDTSSKEVEIDASKIEIIDSAILQLLLSYSLSLKEKNIKLIWHKPTDGLLNKASVLGLTELLGL